MDKAELLVGLLGGPDAMNRMAHSDMARSSLLPADIKPEHRAVLERAGVVFGEEDEREPLMRRATLPEGWRLARADHPIYSHLLDERGRRRALVMCSRIDRQAWVRCLGRFSASHRIDDPYDWRTEPLVPVIADSDDSVLWRGAKVPKDTEEQRRAAWGTDAPTDAQRAHAIAEAKLDEVAPKWRDVGAYWDEEGDMVAFPPHDTPPDPRPLYVLTIEAYSGGRHVDGSAHAEARAADDAEAVRRLRESAAKVLGSYDEVRYWIMQGSRRVHQDAIRRRREHDDYGFGPRGPYGWPGRGPMRGW